MHAYLQMYVCMYVSKYACMYACMSCIVMHLLLKVGMTAPNFKKVEMKAVTLTEPYKGNLTKPR